MDEKEIAFINSEENRSLNKDIIDEFYRKIGRLSSDRLSFIQGYYAWMRHAGMRQPGKEPLQDTGFFPYKSEWYLYWDENCGPHGPSSYLWLWGPYTTDELIDIFDKKMRYNEREAPDDICFTPYAAPPSTARATDKTQFGEKNAFSRFIIKDHVLCLCVPQETTDIDCVTVPDGVTEIGSCAFVCCKEEMNVRLPKSVRVISYRAFAQCSGLRSIDLPAGLTSIASSAFLGCSALESITIPSTVKSIGPRAFLGCSSLRNLIMPKDIEIADDAFKNCPGYYTNPKTIR